MIYYDIHTHRPSANPEDICILNRIVGRDDVNVPGNFQSIGIHPWYISDTSSQLGELEKEAEMPQVAAIGEAGIDKMADTSIPVQEEIFKSQAVIAERIRKPVIIHCVKAWDELIAVKKDIKPEMPWIIHGFRGKRELARQLLKQGFYLSFGENFNPDAVREAWPGNFFAETDESLAGIRDIYQSLATCLEIDIETFAARIKDNVKAVFDI